MKHIIRLSTLLLAVMLYLSDTNAQQSWTRSSNSAKDQTHLQVGALFKFIRTVHVTPDTDFHTGGFARVGHVPATNRYIKTYDQVLALVRKKHDAISISQITGRTLNTSRQYLRLVKDFHPELKVDTGEPQPVKSKALERKKHKKH